MIAKTQGRRNEEEPTIVVIFKVKILGNVALTLRTSVHFVICPLGERSDLNKQHQIQTNSKIDFLIELSRE